MKNNLVKSTDRVNTFGEVFTPDHIVRDMVASLGDGVCEPLHTVLEPSVGTGNFLVVVLDYKLRTFKTGDFGLHAIKCLSSLYGVDIQLDNVLTTRTRLLEIVNTALKVNAVSNIEDVMKTAEYVVNSNILLGDTLTGMDLTTRSDLVINEYTFKDDNVTVNKVYFNSIKRGLNRFYIEDALEYKYNNLWEAGVTEESELDYLV